MVAGDEKEYAAISTSGIGSDNSSTNKRIRPEDENIPKDPPHPASNIEVSTHEQLKSIIKAVDKSLIVIVSSNTDLHSVCSTSIFTRILKKETLKYEIKFRRLENHLDFEFETGGSGTDTGGMKYCVFAKPTCNCSTNMLSGISLLLSLAVEYDLVEQSTFWPCAIAFEYYRELHTLRHQKDRTYKGELCTKCREFEEELEFRFYLCKCNIRFEERSALLFTQAATLFDAIKYGLRTVFSERLFSNRFSRCDKRIHEILAVAGISIGNAGGRYNIVSQNLKRTINERFGLLKGYILCSGHDLELRAVEHAFVISHYLSMERENDAFISLEKRELMDLDAGWRHYKLITECFRELSARMQQIQAQSRATMLFRIQSQGRMPERWWNRDVLRLLWQLCMCYMGHKGHPPGRAVFVIENGSYLYVYSENIDLSRTQPRKEEKSSYEKYLAQQGMVREEGEVCYVSKNLIIADISIQYQLLKRIFSKIR